jgi:L-ectoine synthase
MLVRDAAQVMGTDRDVHGSGWKSRRLIVAADGLPYSVHETLLDAGAELQFRYAVHRETVYCIEGEGSLRDLATGERFELGPGRIYAVGIDEPHALTARTAMKVVCIFDPPLEGHEKAR